MPETVFGLPTHAIVVHATVVLLPLAALVVLLHAFWPAARRRLGIVTPLLAGVALVLVAAVHRERGERSSTRWARARWSSGTPNSPTGCCPGPSGCSSSPSALWLLDRRRAARRRTRRRPLGADRRRRPGGRRRRRHGPADRPRRVTPGPRRPGTASCPRRPPPAGTATTDGSAGQRGDVGGAAPREGHPGAAVPVAGDHRPAVDGASGPAARSGARAAARRRARAPARRAAPGPGAHARSSTARSTAGSGSVPVAPSTAVPPHDDVGAAGHDVGQAGGVVLVEQPAGQTRVRPAAPPGPARARRWRRRAAPLTRDPPRPRRRRRARRRARSTRPRDDGHAGRAAPVHAATAGTGPCRRPAACSACRTGTPGGSSSGVAGRCPVTAGAHHRSGPGVRWTTVPGRSDTPVAGVVRERGEARSSDVGRPAEHRVGGRRPVGEPDRGGDGRGRRRRPGRRSSTVDAVPGPRQLQGAGQPDDPAADDGDPECPGRRRQPRLRGGARRRSAPPPGRPARR